MFEAIVVLALAAQPAATPPGKPPYLECTAQRLKPFVSPNGVRQAWPVSSALPDELAGQLGTLLSDQGNVEDGYSHWLLVSSSARSAFVIERGGYAGIQKVYGPLPVAVCSLAP